VSERVRARAVPSSDRLEHAGDGAARLGRRVLVDVPPRVHLEDSPESVLSCVWITHIKLYIYIYIYIYIYMYTIR
jgi:hypothetical protein